MTSTSKCTRSRLAATLEHVARPGRGRLGILRNLVDRDRCDLPTGDDIAFECGGLLRPPREQHDLIGLEQRSPRTGVDQLRAGALLAEHVGDTHSVERPLAHTLRDVEVGVVSK